MPLSRLNFAATARRKASVPATSVYLVSPDWIARIAASLTFCGVSKSGSPAANPITSRPAAFSARAFVVMAMVWLGLIRSRRSAVRCMFGVSFRQMIGHDTLIRAPGPDNRRERRAALRGSLGRQRRRQRADGVVHQHRVGIRRQALPDHPLGG